MTTIAEVLHCAADHCLAFDRLSENRNKYSCSAVYIAHHKLRPRGSFIQITDGLKAMGCDITSMSLFNNDRHSFAVNPDVQGMRYMWLKWAALMAEEQGV